jgi:CRP/FNR family transcriptional regulator, cyclic AMP receptor protein
MKVTDLFARVPLFASLTDSERAVIAEAATFRACRRGERIVSQGEAGDAFFVVVRGRVSVSVSSPEGREVVLSTLGEGEHFGEMALLEDATRSASVTTTERTDVVILTRAAFFSLLRRNFLLTRSLLLSLSSRLRHADSTIEGLASLDVKGRLARYFCDLAASRGRTAGGGWVVIYRPSQREIADTIGSSRETVSRTMAQLTRENLLVPKGRLVYVKLSGAQPTDAPDPARGQAVTK